VNTLRVEVSPWGIDVITVCPGITKTPFLMAAKEQMERAWSSAPDAVKQSYGEEYAAWWARTTQLAITWLALDPHDAVACLLDAVSARWPKTRYFSGLDARLLARPAVHAPDFLWDSGVKALLFLMGQPRPRSAL
jgi:NAD(P)-dependent dehydrogenase (short-subunit alcohol dehydrogenase family)